MKHIDDYAVRDDLPDRYDDDQRNDRKYDVVNDIKRLNLCFSSSFCFLSSVKVSE